MAGPWEQYQQAPAEDGPWAQYQGDQLAQAQAAPITDLAPVQAEYNPAEDMSFGEQVAARFGGGYVDLMRGGKQVATEAVGQPLNAVGSILEAWGVKGGRESTGAGAVNRSAARQQQVIDEDARLQAPLKRTAGGMVGDAAAGISQILGPGALLRGSSAVRSAFLPTTVRGNAMQGGVYGALQPVETGDSRMRQAGFAAGAGAFGAALPALAGSTARSLRAAVDPLTQRGQERIVAQTLRQSAVDPARIAQAAPSPIPGVQRTLAEETLDPGIAQLQRQFPTQLAELSSQNNAARANAVRSTFNGADDASIASIKASRDAAAQQSLRGLSKAGSVDTAPVRKAIESAVTRHQGNPATQAALRQILGEMPEIKTAQQAYNFRKYIDFTLSKQSDKPAAQQAMRELLTVKSVLDRSMSRAYPQWRSYLGDYKAASRQADQAKVGQAVLNTGRQVADPMTGERVMTPATMAGASNNLRGLVRNATGFRRANPDAVLAPQQKGLLAAMADDASRMDFVNNAGRAAGSNTAQNLATQNLLRQVTGGGRLASLVADSQLGQRLVTPIEKTYGLFGVPDRLQSVLVEALSDPARARAIMGRLPVADRNILENALIQSGGLIGPALTE